MLSYTDKWSPTYDVPAESVISWGSSLSLHDLTHKSLMAPAPDEKPENPALFLTREGVLYLRVCWGRYYILSGNVAPELLLQLRKRKTLEVALIYPLSRLDFTCPIYHVQEIPELIREVEKTETESTEEDESTDQEPLTDLQSVLESLDVPEVATDEPAEDYSELEPVQVARELAVETLWKVDKNHYLSCCQEDLLLLGLFDEKGDWLADEEPFNGELPLWFSAKSHLKSPVTVLYERSKQVAARFSRPVKTVLVLGEGCRIINENDMTDSWQELNVSVCNITRNTDSELPSLADCVAEMGAGVPVREGDFIPVGYKAMKFDLLSSVVPGNNVRPISLLGLALNVDTPLVQKGNRSLWYTPGHLYLVHEFAESGSWLANEQCVGETSPLWFSETTYAASPFYRLNRQAQFLAAAAGVNIHRVLLLGKDTHILNLRDLLQAGKGCDVHFGTLLATPPDGLRSFSDIVTLCRGDDSYLSVLTPTAMEELKCLFDGYPEDSES